MKKELLKLKKDIEEIDITSEYDNNLIFNKLYNLTSDYQNNSQNWIFEDCFKEFIDLDTAEYIVKQELEKYGIERLRYLLGNTYFYNDIIKINAYGNFEDVTYEDLEFLKKDILEKISYELEEA